MADARDERARARASWPIARYPLGEERDQLVDAPPAECVAMVWQLTLDAWAASGRPIPDYPRAESPGRIVRHGRP